MTSRATWAKWNQKLRWLGRLKRLLAEARYVRISQKVENLLGHRQPDEMLTAHEIAKAIQEQAQLTAFASDMMVGTGELRCESSSGQSLYGSAQT